MADITTNKDTFTLLYFAAAATLTDRTSDTFQAPMSISQLYKTLNERYPGIQGKVLNSSALTVNLEYVNLDKQDAITIRAGDEVAIIPPVSSG